MATMSEMVAAVKAHALENYETGGWDYCVECWSDKEIEQMLTEAGVTTVTDAIADVGRTCELLDERRREVRAEIW